MYGTHACRVAEDGQSYYYPKKPVLPKDSYYTFVGWAELETHLTNGQYAPPEKWDWTDVNQVRGHLVTQTYGETIAALKTGVIAVYLWPAAQKLTFDVSQCNFADITPGEYDCPLIENRACPNFYTDLNKITFATPPQAGKIPSLQSWEAFNPNGSDNDMGSPWIPSETYFTKNGFVNSLTVSQNTPQNFPMVMPLDFVSKDIPYNSSWACMPSNPNSAIYDVRHFENHADGYDGEWPASGTFTCHVEKTGTRTANATVYLNDMLIIDGAFNTFPSGSSSHTPDNVQYLSFWLAGYDSWIYESLSPDFGLPYTA